MVILSDIKDRLKIIFHQKYGMTCPLIIRTFLWGEIKLTLPLGLCVMTVDFEEQQKHKSIKLDLLVSV